MDIDRPSCGLPVNFFDCQLDSRWIEPRAAPWWIQTKQILLVQSLPYITANHDSKIVEVQRSVRFGFPWVTRFLCAYSYKLCGNQSFYLSHLFSFCQSSQDKTKAVLSTKVFTEEYAPWAIEHWASCGNDLVCLFWIRIYGSFRNRKCFLHGFHLWKRCFKKRIWRWLGHIISTQFKHLVKFP